MSSTACRQYRGSPTFTTLNQDPLEDGYHFVPLVVVSWIPFVPLRDAIVKLAGQLRVIDKKLAPKAPTFAEYIEKIKDFSWHAVDANSSIEYFDYLRQHAKVSDAQKHGLFNLLPLALSANPAPGETDIEKPDPMGTINIETLHDQGIGEYRGYLHFVPWIRVEDGMITERGIHGAKAFRPNNTGQLKLTADQPFDLLSATSSSSITPVPEYEKGVYADWADVIGGFTLYGMHGRKGGALMDGWGDLQDARKGKNGLGKRHMGVSRRWVMFERAETNPNWNPIVFATKTEAHFDFRHGGRIAPKGRQVGEKMNGREVPWICGAIHLEIDVSGAVELRFAGSLFPAHALYIGVRDDECEPGLLLEPTRPNMKAAIRQIRHARLAHFLPRAAKDAILFTEEEYGAKYLSLRNGGYFPSSSHHNPSNAPVRSQGNQTNESDLFGDMPATHLKLKREMPVVSPSLK